MPTSSRATETACTAWTGPALAAAGLLAIFTWVFWEFLSTQVRWALREPDDWGHTLLIPFIAGFFVWTHRDALLARPLRVTWIGLVPVVVGVAWYSLCLLHEPVRNHNLQAMGVWVALAGLVLLFAGFRAMRFIWFALLYLLIFGQSASDRAMTMVTYELQDIAARGAWAVLMLLGLDVELHGNVIEVFHDGVAQPLNVAEACSGMRMVMALLALGVFLAYTGLRRFWQQALLVLLAVPTALFVNVLRVVSLAILALYDIDLAAGEFHSLIGLLWLVPALLIYLGLMWVIRRLVVEPEDTAPPPPPPPPRAALAGRETEPGSRTVVES